MSKVLPLFFLLLLLLYFSEDEEILTRTISINITRCRVPIFFSLHSEEESAHLVYTRFPSGEKHSTSSLSFCMSPFHVQKKLGTVLYIYTYVMSSNEIGKKNTRCSFPQGKIQFNCSILNTFFAFFRSSTVGQ